MDACLETKTLQAWLTTAVSEQGFSQAEVDHLRSVASMFRSPFQMLHYDKRFFHYILASDHRNHRSTDSVHLTLLEHARTPVTFTLELQSLSGFDIKFHAISGNIILGQVFTETWVKGKQVETMLFCLEDGEVREVDHHKEIARCYGTADERFLYLDPLWSSVATLYDSKTGAKKLCQMCAMREWPAIIVPDPRPSKSHLCLVIVTSDPDTWRYGAEGELLQYNLDDGTSTPLLPAYDPRFSSQLLKYTSDDASRFVAYRQNSPEVLVFDAESLTCLLTVPLEDLCPIMELPFQMPYIVGVLTEADLLGTIQAATLGKRQGALSGLKLRPEHCYFVVPVVSDHFLALAFFGMQGLGQETAVVKLYGPLAKPLDEETVKMLS